MDNIFDFSKPLPNFRSDLQLFRGPDDVDGSPTFNLFDPVRVKYFKITWAESLILQHLRPGMTLEQLIETIKVHSTLDLEEDDIKPFYEEALRYGLLAMPRSSESIERELELSHVNPIKWLLLHYLYVRIPLVKPDAFLTKTVKYVRFLGSRPAMAFYLLLLLTGLIMLLSRFDEFLNTFTYFFNLEGAVGYALGIITVKFVHEFSHAYTAKNYGLHVPTMGVALIVLWPVMYTDVTDGWKLKKRAQRLAISGAGIVAELIIAGLATIGWSLAPPGVFQSICFVIASITWISTLLINLNPAMRFDGYYIACDLWGMDNLQPRAFAVTRWKFRQCFLGMELDPPEEGLTTRRMTGMIIYTAYTLIYRLFLYTAIAIFVYHMFTKALGVFLFLVEIFLFILWPLSWEIQDLYKSHEKVTANPRSITTIGVLLALLVWFVIPLPHVVRFAAVTIPVDLQVVRIPAEGVLSEVNVGRNQKVESGQVLAVLDSKRLDSKIDQLAYEKKILEQQILIQGIREEDRPFIAEKKAELASVTEQFNTWRTKREELTLKASLAGKIFYWNEDLRIGQSLPKDELIGKIAKENALDIIFYVPENEVNSVEIGKPFKFITNSDFRTFYGKITRVDPIHSELLAYPVLASLNQGELAISTESQSLREGKLLLVDTYYAVQGRLEEDDNLQYNQTGYVLVDGPWRSTLVKVVKAVMGILWRESSV